MKILFIEDEPTKSKEISNFLTDKIPEVQILLAESFTCGVEKLRQEKFDLLLLDMSLPIFNYSTRIGSQNEFEPFAGLDILDEIYRLGLDLKTIVVTAFDVIGDNKNQVKLSQLDQKMKDEYCEVYLGVIHYNVSSLEWKNELMQYIQPSK